MLQWKDTVGSSWDTTTQQTGNITELTGTTENVEESLVNGNLKEETVTGISKNPANIKILRQQPVNQNSTEDPKSPSQALSSLSLAGMKQNLFSVAFTLPKATPKPPKDRKRPRPPAVATSDEYRAWFQKIELDKKEEEQIRAEKKAARDAKKAARDVKKAASALRLKAKSKAGPKRAKLVI